MGDPLAMVVDLLARDLVGDGMVADPTVVDEEVADLEEDMLEVLGRFFRETKSLCLKLMMLHKFWRPV